MSSNIPPVPHRVQMVNEDNFPSNIWSDWFDSLLQRVGGNIAQTNTELGNPGSSATSSGYTKLTNGIIIQWGTTSLIASGAAGTVPFPLTFPNTCFQVIAGVIGNGAVSTASTGQWGTTSYTTTSFSLLNRTSESLTFNYLAVGF